MMTWPTGFSENCWTEDVWVHKPAKEVKKKCFLFDQNPELSSDLSFKMVQKLLTSGQNSCG